MSIGHAIISRQPVRFKLPSKPAPAHMRLIGTALKSDGIITLLHRKGTPRGVDLDAAWEAVERGWLEAPERPGQLTTFVRSWAFKVTRRGREAYEQELESYK